MANFQWSEIFILERDRLPAILAPDSDGVPTVVAPPPFVLRAAYIVLGNLEDGLSVASERLRLPRCELLVMVDCHDGAPHRSGLLFLFSRPLNGVSWSDGKKSRHGAQMTEFIAATSVGPNRIRDDARDGRPGYFLTGDAGDSSLWRVIRMESDVFNRLVFTLAPVRLAGNLPAPDFSALGDSSHTDEVATQFHALCHSITQHAYRDVVTKARNIVEALVAARLRKQNQPSSDRLYEDLKMVKKLLDSPGRDACGWTDLEYHLCHKIRLLHGKTHVNQAVQAMPLRPEFALTAVEDLVYLLAAWDFVRDK